MRILRTLGCLVVVVAALLIGALYHREILDLVDRWRGKPGAVFAPAAPPAAAHLDPAAALASLGRPNGPPYVDLTAADLATLVQAALTRERAHAFDSVQVALLDNEVRVRGSIDLHDVPRSTFGPFANLIGEREPAAIGGPLSVDSAGQLLLTVTSLKVGQFPLPRATIPRILAAAHLPGARDASVPLPVGQRFGDVRVSPAAVRLYKRTAR